MDLDDLPGAIPEVESPLDQLISALYRNDTGFVLTNLTGVLGAAETPDLIKVIINVDNVAAFTVVTTAADATLLNECLNLAWTADAVGIIKSLAITRSLPVESFVNLLLAQRHTICNHLLVFHTIVNYVNLPVTAKLAIEIPVGTTKELFVAAVAIKELIYSSTLLAQQVDF